MEGGTIDERNPLPEEFRTYQLIRLTGWTQQQIDETNAALCDWILAFAAMEAKTKGS